MGNCLGGRKDVQDHQSAPTSKAQALDPKGEVIEVLGGGIVEHNTQPVKVLEPKTVAVKTVAPKNPDGYEETSQTAPQRKSQKAWVEDMMAAEEDQARSKLLTSVQPISDMMDEPTIGHSPPMGGRGTGMQQGQKHNSSESAMDRMVNRARGEAEITFSRYDQDRDGYLTREELYIGMQELDLGLTPEMYRQYVDCNFMYADMDGDDRLSLEEYLVIHGMIHEVKRKFERFDKDGDGLINKSDFTKIVKELHLNLDESMVRSYVDMNFRFVDRSFRGTVSFGQFLACYANFLISHSLMHSNKGPASGGGGVSQAPPQTPGNLLLEDIDEDDLGPVNGPLR